MGILIILLLAESVNKSNWFTDLNCNITNTILPKPIVVDSQNTTLKENYFEGILLKEYYFEGKPLDTLIKLIN